MVRSDSPSAIGEMKMSSRLVGQNLDAISGLDESTGKWPCVLL